MNEQTVVRPTSGHPPVVNTFIELAALRSPAREEGPAAEYVRGYLDDLGIPWTEDDAAATVPAGCGNIHATIAPTAAGTPIFLCSHLDTVALEDDVVPVLEDGRITNSNQAILGGDNKAAVAVMLELARELATGTVPHAGVEIVFTPCEELGLLGAKAFNASSLAARYGFVFDHADDIGGIVVEAPTQYSIRAQFTGVASHSGIAPEGGRSSIRAASLAICNMPHGRVDDRSTANVGLISGGSAVNIVPEHCTIRGEARSLDHDRAAQIAQDALDAISDAATSCGVDVTVDLHEEYRAYSFTASTPAVRHATQALQSAGYEARLIPCGGGSDANVFNAAGVPCVNMCNAMRMIHTADEYIDVADLVGMMSVARQLVAHAVDASSR